MFISLFSLFSLFFMINGYINNYNNIPKRRIVAIKNEKNQKYPFSKKYYNKGIRRMKKIEKRQNNTNNTNNYNEKYFKEYRKPVFFDTFRK